MTKYRGFDVYYIVSELDESIDTVHGPYTLPEARKKVQNFEKIIEYTELYKMEGITKDDISKLRGESEDIPSVDWGEMDEDSVSFEEKSLLDRGKKSDIARSSYRGRSSDAEMVIFVFEILGDLYKHHIKTEHKRIIIPIIAGAIAGFGGGVILGYLYINMIIVM